MNVLIILLAGGDRQVKSLTTKAVIVGRGGCHGVRIDLSRFSCLAGSCRPICPRSTSLSLRRMGIVAQALRSNRGSHPQHVLLLTRGIRRLLSVAPHSGGRRGFLRAILQSCRCCTLRRVWELLCLLPIPFMPGVHDSTFVIISTLKGSDFRN